MADTTTTVAPPTQQTAPPEIEVEPVTTIYEPPVSRRRRWTPAATGINAVAGTVIDPADVPLTLYTRPERPGPQDRHEPGRRAHDHRHRHVRGRTHGGVRDEEGPFPAPSPPTGINRETELLRLLYCAPGGSMVGA